MAYEGSIFSNVLAKLTHHPSPTSQQHRLDSVGFQWVVAQNNKSWEERFEDLKEYQQLHGTTRVPRSSGALGEWVHMQRRLYNRKDKNFLSRRAPMVSAVPRRLMEGIHC